MVWWRSSKNNFTQHQAQEGPNPVRGRWAQMSAEATLSSTQTHTQTEPWWGQPMSARASERARWWNLCRREANTSGEERSSSSSISGESLNDATVHLSLKAILPPQKINTKTYFFFPHNSSHHADTHSHSHTQTQKNKAPWEAETRLTGLSSAAKHLMCFDWTLVAAMAAARDYQRLREINVLLIKMTWAVGRNRQLCCTSGPVCLIAPSLQSRRQANILTLNNSASGSSTCSFICLSSTSKCLHIPMYKASCNYPSKPCQCGQPYAHNATCNRWYLHPPAATIQIQHHPD